VKPKLFPARALRVAILALAPLMATVVCADEIHVASSGGFAAAYRALAPGFEARTGHKLIATWGPSMGDTAGAIPKRLARGEPIDVVIMVGNALDQLIAQGKVDDAGHHLLANSKIGVAVPRRPPPRRVHRRRPQASLAESALHRLLRQRQRRIPVQSLVPTPGRCRCHPRQKPHDPCRTGRSGGGARRCRPGLPASQRAAAHCRHRLCRRTARRGTTGHAFFCGRCPRQP